MENSLKCSQCQLIIDKPQSIRCPRCNKLLVEPCKGSCKACNLQNKCNKK